MSETPAESAVDTSGVKFHSEGWDRGNPAVNVKVPFACQDATRDELLAVVSADEGRGVANPHFSQAWLDSHVSEEDWNTVFMLVCERGFEFIDEAAMELFNLHAYSEGRMGGWAVVYDLPDVEEWDADMLSDWQEFERRCQAEFNDIPYQMASYIYHSHFRPWVEA